MIDVVIITDQGGEPPAFAAALAMGLTAVRVPLSAAARERIASARVIVLHSTLRGSADVAIFSKLVDEERRRSDTIYVAVNGERAGLVQAEALKIGCIVPSFRAPQDIREAVQAILNRTLAIHLGGRSQRVARAIESGDALYRQLGAAMRSDRPLPPAILEATAKAVSEVTRRDGLMEWLGAVELHHSQTCRHMMTVAGYASSFGQFLSLHPSDVALLAEAGLLHDVGKLFIPISVLEKVGPLTEMERRAVNTHAMRGAHALIRGGRTEPEVVAAVRDHHEYLDGSGYPRGIGADSIGPLTRMVTIADIYTALTEQRAYKEPMAPRQAIGIMAGMNGKLDQRLFAAFRAMVLDPVFALRRQSGQEAAEATGPCLRQGRHPLDATRENAA